MAHLWAALKSRTEGVRLAAGVSTMREELTCPICWDLLNDPRTLPCCISVFCRSCITQHLTASKRCPNCSWPVIEHKRPPKGLAAAISAVQVLSTPDDLDAASGRAFQRHASVKQRTDMRRSVHHAWPKLPNVDDVLPGVVTRFYKSGEFAGWRSSRMALYGIALLGVSDWRVFLPFYLIGHLFSACIAVLDEQPFQMFLTITIIENALWVYPQIRGLAKKSHLGAMATLDGSQVLGLSYWVDEGLMVCAPHAKDMVRDIALRFLVMMWINRNHPIGESEWRKRMVRR